MKLLCTPLNWFAKPCGGQGAFPGMAEYADDSIIRAKIPDFPSRNNKPGQFFDVSYPVPSGLTKGKEKITVKLQAHPGNNAGGLFGCRVLRAESHP